MNYNKLGQCKGPGYSTGKTNANTDYSQKMSVKVGRSEGLKMSHLSDGAHPGYGNRAGVKATNAAQVKQRRGQ